MHPVVILLLLAAWAGAMWLGFVFVFPVLFPVSLVVAGGVALGLYYLHACQALATSSVAGPSPVTEPEVAYRHYLLVQVWRDWWAIARTVVPRIWVMARNVVVWLTRTLLGGPWGYFTFPVWLALCAGIVAAALPAAALGVVFSVLYAVVAAVGLSGWLVCVLVLAAVERGFMAYGRILQTCPHPFCYEKIALPVYECPGCGVRHPRLAPGRAGAFRHVCRCGARLPTTVPLGRFRLAAYCPHCGGRLPERIGRVRVEPLPFVGGPAAGKTTFMFLGIRALHARARAVSGRLAFVERRHAEAYAGAIREFGRGGRPAKTGPELPLATMVDVDLPGGARRILYLFDPAGEHYTGATEVESLRYLDHGEALLFVVDPFALPLVRRSLTAEERRLVDASAASSQEDPADTLQRVLNELRSRPDRGRQKRVAVVVTKTDLLERTGIGQGAGGPQDAVRRWLEGVGLGNIIRALDQVAGEVRYFGSGLHTPPAEVADLLSWVAGLPAGARAPRADAADGGQEGQEVPGTAPLRAPWPVRGRDSARVPVGYQVGRWALLTGLSVLTVATLAGAVVAAALRLPY
ncbi:TRAFAC clade GTPase domain-containing protein [Actinomadura keratinilytica]|uniref:Double-GTPase 2 domain-containing protein n=1 Tax=Actinomadura keratinilytica TaxID=547461 RepID=A0ABP7ZEP7_9ACTN